METFINNHPFITFLILLFVGIPIVAIVVGVLGEVIMSFFDIFKRKGGGK